ncbi:hypothetical protein B9Z19DRAFT_1125739 [Tuber borchii]|uniref:Uncharacterized protein n=1 Tax=Tuber borchii TaxID=42251 RepID=A0A2T6ZU54_TUBBO|nr:hypothetical protein B9Z19DRAFT_1125739 [Tuber borchii]
MKYVETILDEDPIPGPMNADLQAEIMNQVSETISTEFLLVSLNITAILDETTIYLRREQLTQMTNGGGLSDVYSVTLNRIKKKWRQVETRDGGINMDISIGAADKCRGARSCLVLDIVLSFRDDVRALDKRSAAYARPKKIRCERNPITHNDRRCSLGGVASWTNAESQWSSDPTISKPEFNSPIIAQSDPASIVNLPVQTEYKISERMPHSFLATHSWSPKALRQKQVCNIPQTCPQNFPQAIYKDPTSAREIIFQSASGTNGLAEHVRRRSSPRTCDEHDRRGRNGTAINSLHSLNTRRDPNRGCNSNRSANGGWNPANNSTAGQNSNSNLSAV